MSSERSKPRRRMPRWVIALVAGLIVLYAGVVVLYALSSRSNTSGLDDPAAEGTVGVTLRAETVQAVGNRLGMTIDLTDLGPLDDNGTLSRPVTVVVTQNDGPRVIEFPAETLTSSVSLNFMTDGFVELWPFDRYTVITTMAAGTASGDSIEGVPIDVRVVGGVPGWSIDAHTEDLGATIVVNDVDESVDSIVITASRAGSTIAFGVVLLALMVVMPVLVLSVAILSYAGRRKVEPTLMSWSAAMLFATIPLRTFLPGSPPIGSWIDFLIVLWVIVGLVAGLTIYVLAWRRWSPKLVDGAPLPVSVPVEERVDLVVVDPGEGASRQG